MQQPAPRVHRMGQRPSGAVSIDAAAGVRAGLATVAAEMAGVAALQSAMLMPDFDQAVTRAIDLIRSARGRVIVTGIGKSGIVARKIAATFASTGTPSLFLHPAEASHGDLGMVTPEDIVLALSWSGATAELSDIIAYCHRFDVPMIGMTSRPDAILGRSSTVCLALPPVQEACPNRLAPTTSTTVQMVVGDALAMALVEARGFSSADFLTFHPGGKLGSQLLKVGELMANGSELPVVRADASLMDATIEMSLKRYGCTAVVDADGGLVGAFTDGDLRRCITSSRMDCSIAALMTFSPIHVEPDAPASRAMQMMQDASVSVIFVCRGPELVGVLHRHDILRAGVA